jgi:hypothetical protein
VALHLPVRDIDLEPNASYPCLRRRGGPCSRYLVRVAGGRHNDCVPADAKLLEVQGDKPYANLGRLLADAGNLILSVN